MSDWPTTTLGELIHVKHGYAFKGEHFAETGDKLVLKPGNFPVGGGIKLRPGKDDYYAGIYPPEFELEPGDMLVVMTDLTQAAPILGSPAFVPSEPVMLHNQRLGLVQIKPGAQVDERFLYYSMLSESARAQVRATATGATVRHTAPERLYRVRIGFPDLRVQQSVGEFLGALDGLIDNNRRRVRVLEEMARAIYREWFVNFRYPGYESVQLVDSAVGLIPEGWNVRAASEAVEINPSIKLNRTVEHPFIAMGDVSETSMVCLPSETRSGGSGARFANGDTLLARINPSLQNGKTGFVQCLEDGEVGLGSTEFIVMRGRQIGRAFTYCLARQEAFRHNAIASMVGASGRQRVRNECFDTYFLAVPPQYVAQSFEAAAAPMFAQVDLLHRQATNLGAVRDLLLPRLVTGQIDVTSLNFDRVLEDAVA
ncbi:restriction endonuclease subunit S [Microbacterium sp. LRZ72]|uniref:restriction endonuclease subunit S n=1 Tax=Microbacterium sp. LRZ72 TaxID=2942481 RepID=UPI0029ABA6F6|nr:restriction endonuclease subunit S [Microbacterium sp. LRZ72]MDX2377772.1 restriction endonuclease subunit S [Microbacterium sp. LRZ72]